MPPVFQNYQERIASRKARWKRLQPSGGEYVPALNNKIESDGFDRPEPVTPNLMARRAKLWAHSIVKQIVKEAPNARIPERSLFHECQSFKRGQPGKPSDDCGQQCRRQCLNAKRIDPGSLDRARRAFESHLSRQMDDGARLAAPATWWRVGLNQTWKMVAGSTCAISAVLGQEEPLPHLSGYQVHHRRGIISAASSCVGAMRRGTLRLQI